jgi:replicative DNA helicase
MKKEKITFVRKIKMKKKINSIQLQQPALANIMAEQALLAAIIIDNNTMNQAAMLTPSDFYDSRNAEIFAVIKKNYNSKKIIDLTSFVGSGYEDYILELMDLPSALLNVDTYIKEIKENSNKRQIISLTNDFRDSKIKYEDYIESLQKLYIAKKEPIITSELIQKIKPIKEKNIFGVKVQYGAIFTIAGATSAGKTEFAIEIADVHAKQEDCISIYCVFEGGINEFGLRLKKKNINNESLYMLHNPDIADITAGIEKFKNKKILVVIDYLQMFARRLQANDIRPSDLLKKYTSYIYAKLDEIRSNQDVCFCFLSALNNQGIGELKQLKSFDDITFLKSMKEDGNIQYDSDYIYAMLFADENEKNENKWSLGRKKLSANMRKYILLHPAKMSRIGEDTQDVLYVYDNNNGRYNHININHKKEEKNYENRKKRETTMWT